MITRPTLCHVIPNDGLVSGIASVGSELFVIRYPSRQQIDVFETASFMLKRRILVPGLCDFMWWGHALASCAQNSCLYVSDYNSSSIYRVPISDGGQLLTWKTGCCPVGLSVNNSSNVLVTCCSVPYKLREYLTTGTLVREIALPTNVSFPFHAVQLACGHIAVCHEGPKAGVSVVGSSGQWLRDLSRRRVKPTDAQLKSPRQLVVINDDNVLVSDKTSNLVRLLYNCGTADFTTPSGCQQLEGPLALCLDKSRGRLYVGEWQGGRILVFENVYNSSTVDKTCRIARV